MEVLDSNGSGPTSFERTIDNGETKTPHQVILHTAPPTNAAWFAFCRTHCISMGAAHVLAREVERSGSATLGTYPTQEAAEEIVRVLKGEVGIGGEEGEEGVTCKPMSPKESSKNAKKVAAGHADDEPDKKKAKIVTPASSPDGTNNGSTDNKKAPKAKAGKKDDKVIVNPEIQRLYDEGTITSAEYDRMAAADRLFESEVAAAPTTFAVTKFGASSSTSVLSAEQRFEYNNGRRPDVYDAYAHRHDRRFWVNGRLYEANVRTLDAVCLVEFCRKVSCIYDWFLCSVWLSGGQFICFFCYG